VAGPPPRTTTKYEPVLRSPSEFASIDELERKLNLPRRPRRPADQPEPRSLDRVRRQPHVHHVEQVKKLAPELHICPFQPARAAANRRRLNQRIVEIVVRRSPKRVPPQRARPAGVRASPTRDVSGDREVGSVVWAHSEISVPGPGRAVRR
jgi:hypothetical protein